MDKVNETNGSVFRVNGRKVYCDGHHELPLKEGFLIGEGMAMFGYHRAPKYIVNLETNEVKQLVDKWENVVGFSKEDFDWEKLKTIEHRRCINNMEVDFAGIDRYSDYRNGICCIYWMLYPDGRYFADEDGFGMEDNEEERIFCFIDKHFRVLIPFQPMTDEERKAFEKEAIEMLKNQKP